MATSEDERGLLPPTTVLVRSVSAATGRELLLSQQQQQCNDPTTSTSSSRGDSSRGRGGGGDRANKGIIINNDNDDGGVDNGPEGDDKVSTHVTSPSSWSERSGASSYDSAPSITAIEAAVRAAPGASTATRGGENGHDHEQQCDEDAPAPAPRTEPTPHVRAPPALAAGPRPAPPRSTPVLERSRTAGELLSLRHRELHGGAPGGSLTPPPAPGAPSFEIESVTLPPDGIAEVEIDKAMHTVFSVEVRLHGGLQWIIRKRYSDFRELHERLKRTSAAVKQLPFPKRHVFRSRHQSVVEQRRADLERYINGVLEIRPLIRVPLFNFLEVYVHMASYERKLQRHQKELEAERMKNLLEPELLADLTAAFQRLCSSKYLYHAGTTTGNAGNSNSSGGGGGGGATHTTTTTTTTTNGTTSASGSSSPPPTATTTERARSAPTSPVKDPKVVGSAASPPTTGGGGDTSPTAVPSASASATTTTTTTTTMTLTRASFRRDVLGVFPDMPSGFAMRFMKALADRPGAGGGTSTAAEIPMDDFLRAIAILRCGARADRLRFVFYMCDLDHTGKVQGTGVSNLLLAIYGRAVLERPEYRQILSEGFEQGRVRMTVEDFVTVLPELGVDDILVEWMDPFVRILCETPNPHLLESQEEFNPVVQQKILATETPFNAKEVGLLQDAFFSYYRPMAASTAVPSGTTASGPGGATSATGTGEYVDLEVLAQDFPLEMTDERLVRVFASFGPRANGKDIDIFSFVHVLAIASRGDIEEKTHFAFTLFTSSPDREWLTRDDLYSMLRLDLAQNPALELLVNEFMEKNFPANSTKGLRKTDSENIPQTPSVSGSQLGRFVDAVMKEFGQERSVIASDGAPPVRQLTLTPEEFLAWTKKKLYEMAALRILREAVFIDLGLVPSGTEEELLVAQGCFRPYDPANLVDDDSWYLLDKRWFDHWCKYINFTPGDASGALSATSAPSSSSSLADLSSKLSSGTKGNQAGKETSIVDVDGHVVRPKPFSNYVLLTSDRHNRVLKAPEDLKLGKHFVVIPEQLWLALKSWYGGGPEIRRKVVTTSEGSTILDLYEVEEKKKQQKKEKKAKKKAAAGKVGDVNDGDDDDDDDDDDDPDTSVGSGTASDSEKNGRVATLALPRRMRTGGSVGLTNLGNTCYMNSALQCLSNTQLLAEYFLSGMYLDDVNRTSTLGLQGKLAEVYGKLAEDMWCAKQKAISPRNFKKTIGKFNEAFRGSDQQDAQELLAFLLSGLSEDLNRIQEKPYVEQPDSDGRFDSDLADEWWRNHLRREVSIIVALFTGQYKSLLTCSECGFKSARFEPFTFLQLPLPEPTHTTVSLVFVLSNGLPPMKVSVRLGTAASIFDLKHELMKLCQSDFDLPDTSVDDIKVCEYTGSSIINFKDNKRRLSQIRSIDRLIAYQLETLDYETMVATRSRRPSYEPPLTTAMHLRGDEEVIPPDFLENVHVGTLVEVQTRQHSLDYTPGIIVDLPRRDNDDDGQDADENDDGYYTVRLPRSDEEIRVPSTRLRPRTSRLLYIPVVFRKLNYSALYFKNPFRPAPFGLPNLVRLCPERTTGLGLYKIMWHRLRRFFPDDASPPAPWSLSELDSQTPCSSDEDSRCDADQLITSRIDSVFTGLTSRCGFVLRRVESKGLSDSRTGWLARSFGHVIPCTDEFVDILEEETIAIDWDLEIVHDRETLDKMKAVDDHGSVAKNEAIDKGPVPLRHCLDAFTTEEKISEGYCSSCKKHLEMTKKLEIWRLPPVMVVHLKRFQYTQQNRRKLGSLVEFPVHGLDLATCVAPHVELPERYPVKGTQSEEKPADAPTVVDTSESGTVETTSAEPSADGAPGSQSTDAAVPPPSSSPSTNGSTPTHPAVLTRARRGYTNTNLDQSRCLETKYDLYGVVNHQGALGGGHYTAYAKNFVDDQWYFYDDERVRVVEESKVVSPSAYLLFYLRADMQGVLVKDMYPPNSNKKITDEDIDRFVEEDDRRCRIM